MSTTKISAEVIDKYFAIPFNKHSFYLVHVPTGRSQHENEVEISQEEYIVLLKANQETGAEIRLGKDKEFKAFTEYAPSDKHVWNAEQEIFEISSDDLNEQKTAENITRLEHEQSRTEVEIKVYERMRDRNRADSDDLAMLEALEDYSIDLKKVTKQKGWPLEVEWPIAPEF